MQYPKQFNNCPNCGSEKRIVEEETKLEIDNGHLKPGTKIPATVFRAMIFDPNNTSVLLVRRQFPVIFGLCDVCSDCGTIYASEIQKVVGMAEPQIKGNPPGQLPGMQKGGNGDTQLPFSM